MTSSEKARMQQTAGRTSAVLQQIFGLNKQSWLTYFTARKGFTSGITSAVEVN